MSRSVYRGVRRGAQRPASDAAVRPRGHAWTPRPRRLRGGELPTNTPLVHQIVEASNAEFERALEASNPGPARGRDPLGRGVARGASSPARTGGWAPTAGNSLDRGGAPHTRAMQLLAIGEPLYAVEEELDRVRHRALLGDAGLRPSPVQVMNLHQTKGREADASILLLQSEPVSRQRAAAVSEAVTTAVRRTHPGARSRLHRGARRRPPSVAAPH